MVRKDSEAYSMSEGIYVFLVMFPSKYCFLFKYFAINYFASMFTKQQRIFFPGYAIYQVPQKVSQFE